MGLVRSPLLDAFGHGFSTREGGVSTGRYATLNLGLRWGDDPAHVAENRARLARDGAYDPALLYTVRQVHGAACVRVDGHAPVEVAAIEADALVTTTPGVSVGVYTADCVPILFADARGGEVRAVAAAHAGWRGTVAGIAGVTLEALVAAGAAREDVRVAFGPSIGPCCFEVGDEVADIVEALVPEAVLRPAARRPHVDLWRTNAALLEQAGLAREQIDARPLCTVCHRERFFSYRRDGAEDRAGRSDRGGRSRPSPH